MYALIDANCFYCSVERSFNPALEGKPVIVLSNRDGCVVARSNEAKDLGINMGQPFFQLAELRKQHDIAVFSSNYALYGDTSARLMSLLTHFAEDVEVYSIDEAFLLVEGFECLYPSYQDLGEIIRAKIDQWLRIPVSIGFGPTKTLAKIANRLAKKTPEHNGVCVLDTPEKIDESLKNFPVNEIWGVGRQSARKLECFDIKTADQLRKVPIDWIRQMMTVNGVRLVYELQGHPCKLLEVGQKPKKSFCTEPGFHRVTTDLAMIEDALTAHLSRVCEKLRRQNSLAGCLTVYLKTNRYRKTATGLPDKQHNPSRTIVLPHPTNNVLDMIHYAVGALNEIYAPDYHYQKVGIMLTDLVSADYRETNLFTAGLDEKRLKLSNAVDKLNQRFGSNKLRLASQQHNPEWPMQFQYLSKRCTTRWSEILEAK
ncbi:Y-family DNA polymerase [Spirosoma sp. BT702]|uniref:Y-family DNA polymerase n=2 Tax=Spirosoma profusum TaxID=2771354 RepID=A0A927ATF7_9BACT|nr:Y-family DNA polymerase [Spirosoma profusum]